MQRMPNISLSKREVKNLIRKSFYSSGGESYICKPNHSKTLYKLFRDGPKIIPMSENKERKIVRLHELQLEHSVIPIATISCRGELIGYEMTHDEDDERYSPTYQSRNEKIDFLDETHQILEYFASKDIIYGDVAYRNILFNKRTGKAKFCDMDNIFIEGNPIDLVGTTTPLATYNNACGIDEKADAFVHNMLTFQTLGVDFPMHLDDELELDFYEPGIRVIESMDDPTMFTGEYVIQYVKRR